MFNEEHQNQPEHRTQRDAQRIGGEVQPVAVTGGGGVGLQQFQQTAHQHGSQPSPEEQPPCLVPSPKGGNFVTSDIFNPYHRARAAIHDHVRPLVSKLHVVEGSLREKRGERQHPDQDDTENGKGVSPYMLQTNFHSFF